MPTLTTKTTDTYTEWTDIPENSVVFIQNRGSVPAEVWVGSSAPAESDKGVLLNPESEGFQLQLTVGDTLWTKDADLNRPTQIVAIV